MGRCRTDVVAADVDAHLTLAERSAHASLGLSTLPGYGAFVAFVAFDGRARLRSARRPCRRANGGPQRAGLISYQRGELTLRDHGGLKAAACVGHGADRRNYLRLLA